MNPRHKDKIDNQDSTTDFFLKVIQKEKEKTTKETSTKENLNDKKTKTFDTVGRFYNYMNQTLDKILSNKASVMILSFVMAGILFFSVSGENILTTPTSGTTLDQVPVEVEGLDDSLELTGVPETVQVGLIGPSIDILQARLSKDYKVFLELNDLGEGEHTVKFKTQNFPDTLTVMLVPDTLKIRLSPKVDAKFDLGYRFIHEDEMDTKYSVSVDEMAVKSVTIRASKETLKKIDRVEACIDVAEKTEAFEQDARIKAFDSNGKEVKVDIAPTTVRVKCNVASYSKSVIVKANFIGDLPTGYQISNYSLSQSKITIYGLEKDIKDISVVSVDIDVSELKATTTFNEVAFKKDKGINKFSSPTIDVTVEVEKVITKKFEKIPIKVLNNSKNYHVTFAGEGKYASVVVTGSESKISALTLANIQASIDVDGLKVGSRKVNVKVAVDDDKLDIQLLSSSQVTINIERK